MRMLIRSLWDGSDFGVNGNNERNELIIIFCLLKLEFHRSAIVDDNSDISRK